jgi:hypothetical protein
MAEDLKRDNPLFKDKGLSNMEVNKEVKHKTIRLARPRLHLLPKLLNRELLVGYSMVWTGNQDHHLNTAINSNNSIIMHLNNNMVTVAIIKATINNKLLQLNPQLNNHLKPVETKALVTRGKAGPNDMEVAFRTAKNLIGSQIGNPIGSLRQC